MYYGHFSVGQIIGILIFFVCCNGLPLAGFHGGTAWSLLLWLFLSVIGGTLGGLLMGRSHRIAGMMGGFIAGPLSLLAVYLYCRNRQVVYTAEVAIVQILASLPGLGVYFVLAWLSDMLFPPPSRYVDRPRRILDDEDEDEEDRPRRRRRDQDDEDEDDRPRRRRRRRDDD